MTNKRHRSNASLSKDQAITQGLQASDPRDPNGGGRHERIPMDQGMNLEVMGMEWDDENYHYHWIAEHPDRGGRVDKAIAAYYEHVTDEQGNNITRPSGNGVLYLMRLPIQYWREDQERKRQRTAQTLMDEAELKENEYAPTKRNREGAETSLDRRESDNPYA